MTTKQIAEAVGRPEKTVRSWAKKSAAKSAEATAKMAAAQKSGGIPSNWSIDETVAILDARGARRVGTSGLLQVSVGPLGLRARAAKRLFDLAIASTLLLALAPMMLLVALAIRLEDGRDIAVVQIAGLIARRILCDVREGETVETGGRFGIIRFGSRTDLYLPHGVLPLVSVGQTMIGGETVIAELDR